ncbi:MAG: hypothetical protein JST00_25985 [Deltaproteobacteria bacterium]|nr:hypothetical protein [Deltaproteobacteria bacterium]
MLLVGLHVCDRCRRLIGELASLADEEIWNTNCSIPSPTSEGFESACSPPLESSLSSFKAKVAQLIPKEDAWSHVHLAEAYREMGLSGDAVREVGLVLESMHPIPTVIASALQLVLTPPLLKGNGLAVLMRRLPADGGS